MDIYAHIWNAPGMRILIVGRFETQRRAMPPLLAPVPATLSLPVARRAIRDRLAHERTQEAWSIWLADQRSCATIVIVDPSLSVPSSTPTPRCGATDP